MTAWHATAREAMRDSPLTTSQRASAQRLIESVTPVSPSPRVWSGTRGFFIPVWSTPECRVDPRPAHHCGLSDRVPVLARRRFPRRRAPTPVPRSRAGALSFARWLSLQMAMSYRR